jgi:hypothetical protein
MALVGVFDAHPRLFDQERAQKAILDTMFGEGAAGPAGQWQEAYARAQIILAEAKGTPLKTDRLKEIGDLTSRMAAAEDDLRRCVERKAGAIPASVLTSLLDDMASWRERILSLASPKTNSRQSAKGGT